METRFNRRPFCRASAAEGRSAGLQQDKSSRDHMEQIPCFQKRDVMLRAVLGLCVDVHAEAIEAHPFPVPPIRKHPHR